MNPHDVSRTWRRVLAATLAIASVGVSTAEPVAAAPDAQGDLQIASEPAYTAVRVERLVDTRSDAGAIDTPLGRLQPGVPLAVEVAGVAGIPATGVAAVDLNVGVTAVDAIGFVSVYPCADGDDGTSRSNFAPRPGSGGAISVTVLAQLDVDGMVCFETSAAAYLVVDTSGWLPTEQSLRPVPAVRLLDTRDGSGDPGVRAGQLVPTEPIAVDVTGSNGVPSAGASAALLSVTAVRGQNPGFVSVYPCAAGWNGTSNLNHQVATAIANLVIAPIDPNGEICLRSSAPVDLVVDLSGWFADGAPLRTLEPARVFDTRTGQGSVPAAALEPFVALPVNALGVQGVPTSGVGSVSLNVVAARGELDGFLSVFPCAEGWNGTASLNFPEDEPISNAVITPVDGSGEVCFLSNRAVDVIVDVNGWFGERDSAVADSITISEDSQATTIDVQANDVTTGAIAAITQPANGTAAISGTSVTYRPDADYCNDGSPTDDFTYTHDPSGSTATVSVTVTCTIDDPVAVDDALAVDEDSGTSVFDVLANDTNPEGDVLTVNTIEQPANGLAEITDGGTTISYTPPADFCHTGNSQESFDYTILPARSRATVTVTVTCVDDPPVANDDAFQVLRDSGTTSFDVLSNDDNDPADDPDDTSLDGGPISIGSVTQATNGTVTIGASGVDLTYRPDDGYCNDGQATDDFTYTLTPGDSTSTVAVSVLCDEGNDLFRSDPESPGGANDRNAIGNVALTVGATPTGGVERYLPGNLLDNDQGNATAVVDIEGDTDLTDVATSEGGRVTSNGLGEFTYTPPVGFSGTDSFTYTNDNTDPGATSVHNVTIEVTDPVWFVDVDAAGGGDGSAASPFTDIESVSPASGSDPDDDRDTIFVSSGTYVRTGPSAFEFEDGQRLVGESAGLVVDGTELLAPTGSRPILDAANVGLEAVGVDDVVAEHVVIDADSDAAIVLNDAGSATFTAVSIVGFGSAEAVSVTAATRLTTFAFLGTAGQRASIAGTGSGTAIGVRATGTATVEASIDLTDIDGVSTGVQLTPVGQTALVTATIGEAGANDVATTTDANRVVFGAVTPMSDAAIRVDASSGFARLLVDEVTVVDSEAAAVHLSADGSASSGGSIDATLEDSVFSGAQTSGQAIEAIGSGTQTGGDIDLLIRRSETTTGRNAALYMITTGRAEVDVTVRASQLMATNGNYPLQVDAASQNSSMCLDLNGRDVDADRNITETNDGDNDIFFSQDPGSDFVFAGIDDATGFVNPTDPDDPDDDDLDDDGELSSIERALIVLRDNNDLSKSADHPDNILFVASGFVDGSCSLPFLP